MYFIYIYVDTGKEKMNIVKTANLCNMTSEGGEGRDTGIVPTKYMHN